MKCISTQWAEPVDKRTMNTAALATYKKCHNICHNCRQYFPTQIAD